MDKIKVLHIFSSNTIGGAEKQTVLTTISLKQFNEKYGLMGDKAIDVKVRSDLYNIVKQFESITDDYSDRKEEEVELEEELTNG